MKNVMYKIIMGCYIVAALVLVTACNDNLDIQAGVPVQHRNTASTQKAESRGNRRNTLPTGAWRLLPADYLSDTVFPAGRQRKAGNG